MVTRPAAIRRRGADPVPSPDVERVSAYAHVLRRTGFGPFPGQVQRALDAFDSVHDLIDERLSSTVPFVPFSIRFDGVHGAVQRHDSDPLDIHASDPGWFIDPHGMRNWWVNRMLSDEAGVHEKMMWAWHGIMPSSVSKIDRLYVPWLQLEMFHEHALGNLRDLLVAITKSGAMLFYLDGAESKVDGPPNENYARELMQQFALGVGNYDQDDVVAASKVLAGWVNDDRPGDNVVTFIPSAALRRPVTVLGVRGVKRVPDLIDAILRQDACAPYVVGRLWDSLIGGRRDERVIGRWAASFRAGRYEIRPLVRTMLHSETFLNAVRSRPRSNIEWYLSVLRATGCTDLRMWHDDLSRLGQSPYLPPSVAGWPNDLWLSNPSSAARMRLLSELPIGPVPGDGDLIDRCVDRCSLTGVTAPTRAVLADLEAAVRADPTIAPADGEAEVMRATLMSPEFALA